MKKLKLKKGGDDKPKSKTYTNKAEYDKALQAYNDSLINYKVYNSNKSLNEKTINTVGDMDLHSLFPKKENRDILPIALMRTGTDPNFAYYNKYKKPVVIPEYKEPTIIQSKIDDSDVGTKPIMMPSGSYMQKDDFIKRYGEKPWLKATGQKFNKGGTVMKKLKIQRKKYANGSTAVGVVGDEDMSASSLRGDDLSAWNAAQTQAEKDKILADANAKKTAKNNATMAAVGNTLNAGSKALGKGDQHSSDVEQGVDVVQDTVASVVPVAGLFHGISEMGQSLGAKIDPKNADKQKYFFEPHRLITDGLIGGEFAGTADWQVAEKKKKQEEGIATALRAQSDVNYVPKMKEGGEVSGAGGPKDDKVKMTLQERSFVVPAENADKAEALRKKYLGKTTKKMKSGGNVPVKLSDGEHVFTPEERDVLESNGVDLTALAPNAKEDDFNLKYGGFVPKGYQDSGGISGNAITIGGGDTKPSKKYQIGISEEERMAEMTPEEQRAYEQSKIYGGLTQEAWVARKQAEKDAALAEAATEREKAAIQQQYADIFNAAKLQTITPEERAAAENADKKNKLLKVSDALGGATGALALAQIGLGLGQTLSGKRPKFKIDSEFLGRVGDALKSEKSGLPEATKTAALNKLGLGRKALTNYATSISGGNTGTAFAAAKEAAGQEAAGIVELASRDAMMQLQKKNRTDSLVSHLQGLKRQAFEDDLNAFSQNQQAGAQLTQAGISNFSQNLQYKDFMKRWEARNPTT